MTFQEKLLSGPALFFTTSRVHFLVLIDCCPYRRNICLEIGFCVDFHGFSDIFEDFLLTN